MATNSCSCDPSPRSGKCRACGATESLKFCSRCRTVAYCSRACQTKDWKNHKARCKVIAATIQAHEEPEKQLDGKFMRSAMNAQKKALRQAKKENIPIYCASMTSRGIVAPGMPVPDGVPANFGLKQAAVLDFHSNGGRMNKQFLGEAKYRDYYDDLVSNEEEWLEFFHHPLNTEHAEHTCGVLGTLATIYRQRGSYEQCGQVLEMEMKVMDIYKQLSSAPGISRAQIICCEGLEYKMNMIRFNLNMNLRQTEANIPLLRDLCAHEVKYDMSFDEQNYLFMIEHYFPRMPPTVSDVRELSSKKVMVVLERIASFSESEECQKSNDEEKKRTALLFCGHCNKQETALGEFKFCVRCSKVAYCNKACQKAAWKQHKKVCG